MALQIDFGDDFFCTHDALTDEINFYYLELLWVFVFFNHSNERYHPVQYFIPLLLDPSEKNII